MMSAWAHFEQHLKNIKYDWTTCSVHWISSLDMCWDHFEKMCKIQLKRYWQSHPGHILWLHSRCDPNVPSSPISNTCYGYIPNVIKLCLVETSEANWSSSFNVSKMFPLVPGALAPSESTFISALESSPVHCWKFHPCLNWQRPGKGGASEILLNDWSEQGGTKVLDELTHCRSISSSMCFDSDKPCCFSRYSWTQVMRWSLKVPVIAWWRRSGESNLWIFARGKLAVNGCEWFSKVQH